MNEAALDRLGARGGSFVQAGVTPSTASRKTAVSAYTRPRMSLSLDEFVGPDVMYVHRLAVLGTCLDVDWDDDLVAAVDEAFGARR
jgi:hypothetical protein